MVTQNGIKLAVHLITNHFGNLVAKVCENLLRKGTLTLEHLIRFTELTREQVKNSLLVLIQHNCVQAYSLEVEGGSTYGAKANTQYLAIFDNILHRLRFPKFLATVSENFDNECVELFEGLLRDGRLTITQMVARASQRENPVAEDVVRDSLLKLVTARYVERCPVPEPVISKLDKDETTAKKRAAKSAKINEITETLEQSVLAAAVPMEVIRFSVTTNTGSCVNRDISSNSSPIIGVGEKRKLDAYGLDKEPSAEEKELVLWRANFEEFIRGLRHKACTENVRKRLDDDAAMVLKAILEETRSAEEKVKMESSVPLSLNTIFEAVIKIEVGRTMTFDRVQALLVQLGCPQRSSDASFSIGLNNIIELARNDEVESIVKNRYGQEAYRMFRLLSKSGCLLETDKIANDTFVEKKDTPKILYKLWKDDYLHMEKLAFLGFKQPDFLLWKVNKLELWKHILDEMCHAALNLSIRLAYEKEKDNEVLNIPKEKRVGPVVERFKRIRKVWLLLESALMKLDDALMLFHDF
ncbi:DNA-directed RNA polymerase III subunit RPC3 [Quillaja saponaria]|uniref:DNA-directed RNA polymerase III subunit RPC3 n=1 Tax=Quillaja saponaria TaxID=32244 RepID=A0AAD7PWY0_QUISA|nr:DNA-directed RNA polymerase III subunit RPC3 [Quillaja saponaria]